MTGLKSGTPITKTLDRTINMITRDLSHIKLNIGMIAETLLRLTLKTLALTITIMQKKSPNMSKKMPWWRIGSRFGKRSPART